ncbi:hypothetical protein M0805_000931 [Coniferiporia weirii]|nr:hypothetical protein M0805_000931 [Coniferiporia weirii]
MSVRLAPRPRLPVPRAQPVFSRGVRLPRRTVGDDVNTWLNGPGMDFKQSADGPNWLGKIRPFPMNPSFRPPPPVADKTKNLIYDRFMSNPKKFNVRVLSVAFGISLKRIDAILRLKGLERSWKVGKELQTGFVDGMERMLQPTELVIGAVPEARKNVTAADKQDQDEADDHARDRYQRLFWEPVVGKDPIVPQSLEQAKEEIKAARLRTLNAKSDVKLLTGREGKDGPSTMRRVKTFSVGGGRGRPATVFKDVGGRFLDVEDRTRRMHEAERRKQAKEARRVTP